MKFGTTYILRAGLLALFLGAVATPARADWVLTPYLGVVFGGAANTFSVNDLADEFEQRITFGGSLALMGNGVFGFEVDYNLTPNFFQITGGSADLELFDLDSSIQTLMGNVIIGVPVGGTSGVGIRPYIVGGVGLMRSNLSSPTDLFNQLSTHELGVNVGGGVNAFFSDALGLRADVRYFRALEQNDDNGGDFFLDDFGLENFHYWRATLGVTFRFGG